MKRNRSAVLEEESKRASLLKNGMAVEVEKDDGSKVKTTTTSDPWFMGGHSWMIMLEGISGGYSVLRVSPI